MKNGLRYGPTKKMVKIATDLTWPLMTWGKRLSDYPILKHIINPFFAYPYNEVTAIPINEEISPAENLAIPAEIVERFVAKAAHIVIFDECLCRKKFSCTNHPVDIGCLALGKGAERIHPSHGRRASAEDAAKHIQKAAKANLIANIAHVWIDVIAFGLPDFKHLMFICFCDDCCCMYRTDMKHPGPNLNKAYHRLPGITVELNKELCTGCETCSQQCFVQAIEIRDGKAHIGSSCKGCARCVRVCPEKALTLNLDETDILFRQLMDRVQKVADIT